MELLAYSLGAFGGLVLIYANVFANVHRDSALWMSCLGAILSVVGAFAYAQDWLWENDAKAQGVNFFTPGNGATPEIGEMPTELPPEVMQQLEAAGVGSEDIAFAQKRHEECKKRHLENIPSDAVFVFLGNSVAWTNVFTQVVLRQYFDGKYEDMIVAGMEDGNLWVDALVFNENGEIVCKLDKNEVIPNADHVFHPKRTPNRLTVFDKKHKMVLDVEFINPRAIRFLGDYYLKDGVHVKIEMDRQQLGSITMSGNVVGQAGGAAFSVK